MYMRVILYENARYANRSREMTSRTMLNVYEDIDSVALIENRNGQ